MEGLGAALGMGLVFALCGFLLAVAVGAVILRVACGLVGVAPVPELGRAMMIVLANGLAVLAASIGLAMVGLHHQGISLLVSVATSCAIYSAMIPTDYAKALMIWLTQALVIVVVAVVFGLVFGGSMLMMAS